MDKIKEMQCKLGEENTISRNLMENEEYVQACKQLKYLTSKIKEVAQEECKSLLFKYDEVITTIESFEKKEAYRIGYEDGKNHFKVS